MNLNEVLKSTLLIGPEIALIFGGIIVMVIDPLIKGKGRKELFWVALLGLALGFALNLQRFHHVANAFSGALSLDEFAAYFNVIFIIGAFLAIVLSRDYVSNMDLRANEYYALILFSTSGMMILSSAKEFMSLFSDLKSCRFRSTYSLALT